MPRRVLVQRCDESFDLVEVHAPNEHHLQELMKSNPRLVPSDDLGLFGDLLVIGRETTLASGKIDLLCLARSGDVVLIEFKTGPQNPDFRGALAQLIDYGSDLWKLSRDEFDRGVVERYLKGNHCGEKFKAAPDLKAAISLTDWNLSTEDSAALESRLSRVLATGDFIYVVAAQRFTHAMTTTLEYLNSTMRFGCFYLVEVVRLEGKDLTAHAAQVVASPPVRGTSGASPASQANLTDFLDEISDDSYREAMRDVFSRVSTLGLITYWGLKGASFRIKTTDRNEPLSIGWAFLQGDQFFGARHLTLGVDMSSLKQTPTASHAVLEFVERIKTIHGSQPVPTSLNAYTFEPSVVPNAKPAIVEALEALVEDIQSQPEGTPQASDAP